MNLALAAFGGYPASTWESEEGAHTPSGSKTPIVICGWLLKMKREHRKFRSTWNRRWFTVEDGAFHWYKTASSDACGRLCLEDIKSARRYAGTEHGSYTFVVTATNREMLLRAESANDESRWIRGLTLQTDLVHGGTFMGPPSAKNRRRTVLKLMGENCCGGSGSDGRGDQNQNGGGNNNGGGGGGGRGADGWKAEEGSRFREINDRIRAIMNDQDGGPGRGSPRSIVGGKSPTRYYSDRLPAQKSKITPRDPRGISIAGGRGLGKIPAKDDGSSSHRTELGVNGVGGGGGGGNSAGGGSGARRFSYTTSKVVPIATPASPGCCSPEGTPRGESNGGGNDHLYEAQNISSARTDRSSSFRSIDIHCRGRSCSSSTDDGRWPVVSRVGVSGAGRPKPPMPSAPPPANARSRGAAKRGVPSSKNDLDARWDGDDESRGEKGRPRRSSRQHRHSGDGRRKGDDAPRRKGPCQTRRKGGRGRRDREQFGDLADCSSSEESSSRTRDDPFMDEYVSGDSPRVSTPSQHPSAPGEAKRQFPASATKAATITSSSQKSIPAAIAHSSRKKGRRRRRRQHPKQDQRQPYTDDSNDAACASDDDDDDDDDDEDEDDDSSSPASPHAAARSGRGGGGSLRRSERNFDNDDYSREEEVSVDRTDFWVQAGYDGENGASADFGGNGGACKASAGSRSGGGGGGLSGTGSGCNSRGGSATAEDMSWNAGMMGGSSSRSAGSSSRGGSGSRPLRRRYLVEQNEFRQQGW
eukprot:g16785.t1